MALIIHVGGASVIVSRGKPAGKTKDAPQAPYTPEQYAELASRLARIIADATGLGAKTSDEEEGHEFHGNQYTKVAGLGPKPTSHTAKSAKSGLHQLFSSGHEFTLQELMDATGMASASNMQKHISDLKSKNYAAKEGQLDLVKTAAGTYKIKVAGPASVAAAVAPVVSVPAAKEVPAPAEAPMPNLWGAAKPLANGNVLTTKQADEHYTKTLDNLLTNVTMDLVHGNDSPDTMATVFKLKKAKAMAQWSAYQSGKETPVLPQQVFPEDLDLMAALGASGGEHEKIAAAYQKWKEDTHAAKQKAAQAPTPAPSTPAKTAVPSGPLPKLQPGKPFVIPADHKHMTPADAEGFDKKAKAVTQAMPYSTTDGPKNKAAVEKALRARLKDHPAFQKFVASAASAGIPTSGQKSVIAQLVQRWASSSGDHNTTSCALQHAISEEFAMDKNAGHMAYDACPDAKGTTAENVNNLYMALGNHVGVEVGDKHAMKHEEVRAAARGFIRAMYDHTQDQLKAAGITELHLFRGSHQEPPPGGKSAEVVDATMQPASSFTTSHTTAVGFSATGKSMFLAKVPASQVLGSYGSGFGCSHENEFVVMSSPGFQVIHVKNQSAYGDPGPNLKLAAAAKSKDD